MEGLYLVARYTYVQGITVVSCVFMVEVTILDYSMKVRPPPSILHPILQIIMHLILHPILIPI